MSNTATTMAKGWHKVTGCFGYGEPKIEKASEMYKLESCRINVVFDKL